MVRKEAGSDHINHETVVNPEEVWGSEFRVLEIIGNGTGKDFEITGLNLPREWELKLKELKLINKDVIKNNYDEICSDWGFSLDKLYLDRKNILREIVIKNDQTNDISKLVLTDQFPFKEQGIYQTENTKTIESVFLLQQLGCIYLKTFRTENDYAYIAGSKGCLGSRGLKVPEKYFKSDSIVTHSGYQQNFIYNAYNIAGRFGLDLENIHFDDKGILDFVHIQGNAATYALEKRNNRQYSEHNIDTLEQAMALHTIVASYINFLLERDNF